MIGDLRTRVDLYVPNDSPDDMGGVTTEWVFYAHAWVRIEPRGVTEVRENGRLSVTQSYRVVTRFRPNFPERLRLHWGERVLRVVTASDPDTRRERLHLICEEEQQ